MKTVLITGGTGGIGKAIAILFAQNNYNVKITYHKNKKEADCLKAAYNIDSYKVDFNNFAEVEQFIKQYKEDNPYTDILVNNAGIAHFSVLQDTTVDKWDEIFNVNLKSVFILTKELVPQMIAKKSGCVINIGSVWGVCGASCEAVYSAAKSALTGFTKAMAKELGPCQITVNTVAPGFIDTEMNSNLTEKEIEDIVEQTPLRKKGTAKEIADLVYFLSNQSFITGQIIVCDGGLTL